MSVTFHEIPNTHPMAIEVISRALWPGRHLKARYCPESGDLRIAMLTPDKGARQETTLRADELAACGEDSSSIVSLLESRVNELDKARSAQ